MTWPALVGTEAKPTPIGAPRSNGYQTRSPRWFRGPSQMASTVAAWSASRQLGAAGAPGMPHTFALALNVHVRGSSITPSVTPSAASHAAMADALAALNCAVV